jgi:hypothetical protein
MANIYPTQQRTIDPYAEYNSNATNRLTRVNTLGRNCILIPAYLDVTIDSTNQVIISIGKGVVDDVLIDMSASFPVDFREADFYLSNSPFNEAGIYYLTMYYAYTKSKPAPRAYIKIFKHSERGSWNENYLFLKAVKVEFTGTRMVITDVYDADPNDTTKCRRYLPMYILVVNYLPIWTPDDNGKIIYNEDDGFIYVGGKTGWIIYSQLTDYKNTENCDVGSLGYLDGNYVEKAISNDVDKLATCVVIKKGTEALRTGLVTLYGVVDNILVESGRNIAYGDRLYLSATEEGKLTNIAPTSPNISQSVGFAIEDATSPINIKIWFCPDIHLGNVLELIENVQYKVKVSHYDEDAEYLYDSISVGIGLTKSITDPGGSEKLHLDIDGKSSISSNDTTPGYLQNKFSAGSGILLAILNEGGNELLRISSTGGGGGGYAAGVEVGVVVPYAAMGTPDGYLLCDGSLYDSTTYADLFNIIGENYNEPGDIDGFFRVPDLRHKVIVGIDSTASFYNEIGEIHEAALPESGEMSPYGTIAMNYIIRYSADGLNPTDEMVKIDAEDDASGYLDDKLDVGVGLSKEVIDTGGGDKILRISMEDATTDINYKIYEFETEITDDECDVYSLPAPTTIIRDLYSVSIETNWLGQITARRPAVAAIEFPRYFYITPEEDLVVSPDWTGIHKLSRMTETPQTVYALQYFYIQSIASDLIPPMSYYVYKNPVMPNTVGQLTNPYSATATTWNFYPIAGGYFNIPYRRELQTRSGYMFYPSLFKPFGNMVFDFSRSFGVVPNTTDESVFNYDVNNAGEEVPSEYPITDRYPAHWVMGVYPAPTIDPEVSQNQVVLKAGTTYTIKIRSMFGFTTNTPHFSTYLGWDGLSRPTFVWGNTSRNSSYWSYDYIVPLVEFKEQMYINEIWNLYKNAGTSKIRLTTLKKSSMFANLI